jgi:DNA-binding NtrC family response regulator
MAIRIALYSPDPKLHQLLASALRPACSVLFESDKDNLKQIAAGGQADVLVLDFDSNYSSLAEQLAFYDGIGDSRIPIVVMTDDLRRSTATEFLQRGAYDCIGKPPALLEFKVIVGRAYEHALMKAELQNMRRSMCATQGCDQLIGSSGRAQVVYDLIRRVANLNAFALITGESGTGKELVATAIHNLGNRAKNPFIAVSCGAIPESLIEAELFGHEKGAFTGSTGARAGYMERAGEGTLFLDEIGELSLHTQVKLLRVLQQREFSRLGGSKLIPLSARVLFATHRNLQQMVEAGSFRQDLFFRVNVMTIHVPPLRARTEDIPMLARHFQKRYAAEYDKPVHDIRPNAMELLVEYHWPGNIRELENVIQSAVILADGDSITRGDLPDHIQQLAKPEMVPNGFESDGFEERLRQYKINLANNAITECNGNKSHAARKLRVSRAYLHRLIRVGSGGTT